MPSPAKIFLPGSLHFVTTSVEEGFMFPPNPYIEELIKKCLSQAQAAHPVRISHFLLNTTHMHMMLSVIDPQDAADFMERFKTESAHAINRLLGRKKRTVWCEGYDSPLIKDLETAKSKIAYIYGNASADGLVDKIEQFPGFNSWRHFNTLTPGADSMMRISTYLLPRDAFTKLPAGSLKEDDYVRLRRLLVQGRKSATFTVDLNSWMERLGVTEPEAQHEVNQSIIEDVRLRELNHREARKADGRGVMGRKRLVETAIGAHYIPARTGKKMLLHSVDRVFRREQLRWLRELIAEGRRVLERWRVGDFSEPYPMGLFPPTGIRLAEPLGW
jgi:REP element-mobilizing transposase RayT